MIKYITNSELKNIKTRKSADKLITESFERAAYNSTFLSYSSTDLILLPSVITILENHGASVYLDKKDSRLPEKTSKDTGRILRDTIKKCNNFVMFVTDNSKDSVWVPWELGLADGSKSSYKVAVFPSVEKSYEKEWTEQEYLGLYDRIIWGNFTDKEPEWLVWNFENNSAITLRDWLRR